MKNQANIKPALPASRILRRRALNIAILALLYPSLAIANPDGAQIVNGQVGIDTSTPGVTTITNSPNAIINWQNFNIAQHELTQFIQQNGQSAVLNRIIGQNPSEILGQLVSNGKVFLINPNGIVFGAGAVIDTQGLVASSLNLSDQDFLSGNYHFIAGSKAGSLVNEGIIRAGRDGNIVLIAPQINNNGIIQTDNGSITLAAGQELTITSLDSPDIRFQVQAPADSVLNLGKLLTEGGAVNVFAGTIQHSGDIRADSVQIDRQGNVQLVAQQDITLAPNSTISADNSQGNAGTIHIDSQAGTTLVQGTLSAQSAAGQGGHIDVFGERVGLLDGARLDAGGANGGGQVLVGGDYQGKNAAVHNAKAVYVDSGAAIKADATTQGNGGKIIVWSDNDTRIHGKLSAEGGSRGGNGGFIETSGKNVEIADTASISTAAANGAAGTWLIDPLDFTISAGSGAQTNSGIGATTLSNSLGRSNITIVTDASTAGNGDIFVNSAVSWSSNLLTLSAHRNIYVNADLNGSTGGITLNAGGSITESGGAISTTGLLTTSSSGGTTLNGANTIGSFHASNSGSGNISLVNTASNLTLTGISNATNGDTSITNTGMITNSSSISGNNIILKADKMALAGGTISGNSSVNLLSGNAIDLGTVSTDSSTGKLELSNAEIGTITSPMLRIGDSTSGAIDIKSALNYYAKLSLTSGSSITQQAGATIGATALKVSGASVTLNEANPVGVIAGSATSSGGQFSYKSSNPISLTTVDGLSGITTNNGNVSLTTTSGDLVLLSQIYAGSGSVNLTSAGSVSGSGVSTRSDIIGGTVSINARNNIAGSGGLRINAPLISQLNAATGYIDILNLGNGLTLGTVSAYSGIGVSGSSPITVNGTVTSTTGGITLQGSSLNINNTINASSAGVDLVADNLTWDSAGNGRVSASLADIRPYSSGRAITVGAPCVNGSGNCLSITELWRIAAPTIGLGHNDAGDIYVSGITSGVSTITDRNAATTRIGLLSNGSITQSATAINVQDLGIEANGTVLLNATNAISNLAAKTQGQDFTFRNGQGFNIVQMSGSTQSYTYNNSAYNKLEYNISGINTCSATGTCGSVTLTSNGSISENSAPIKAANLTIDSGGDVTLAGTNLISNVLDINAAGSIYSRTQGVTRINRLNASNGSIDVENKGGFILGPSTANPGQTVASALGKITIKAKSPLTVNGGVASATGSVELTADNSDVLSVNAPISAAAGVTLTGGSLTGNYALLYSRYFNGGSSVVRETLQKTVTSSTEQITAGVLGTLTQLIQPLSNESNMSINNLPGSTPDGSKTEQNKNLKQCSK